MCSNKKVVCNNTDSVHDNEVINETPDGIRVYCKRCKQINVLRMDLNGRMNNKEYAKIFKKDILQPGENLYYKENPTAMSVV